MYTPSENDLFLQTDLQNRKNERLPESSIGNDWLEYSIRTQDCENNRKKREVMCKDALRVSD
jgi:hypothetical protein